MVGLVTQVRTKVNQSCLARNIQKEGCSVSLNGAPKPRLIVDFDKIGSPLGLNQVRCDYLFIAEDSSNAGWVCPMELKRGGLSASEIVAQLRAGAQVAEQIVPQNIPAEFQPVAIGRMHIAERAELRRKSNKVSFRGRQRCCSTDRMRRQVDRKTSHMSVSSVVTSKKLIEVALPLEAINVASAREKSIRHGHPSTLHLWWARQPLAAARDVLFAQLVDDPSARP